MVDLVSDQGPASQMGVGNEPDNGAGDEASASGMQGMHSIQDGIEPFRSATDPKQKLPHFNARVSYVAEI